jgi:hypothetical protein
LYEGPFILQAGPVARQVARGAGVLPLSTGGQDWREEGVECSKCAAPRASALTRLVFSRRSSALCIVGRVSPVRNARRPFTG